jgi:hypothetical protein
MTFQTAALTFINNERAQRNLHPLLPSSSLDRVAQDGDFNGCGGTLVHGRCQDMGERNYFSHTIKDCANKSFTHMLQAAGITHSGAGENVAFVSAADDEAVAVSNLHGQLMADSGHASNILSSTFTHVGIGVWRTATGASWSGATMPLQRVFVTTQIFARNPAPVDAPGGQPLADLGAAYHAITPARLLDTRSSAAGALAPGATRDLQVTSAGGVPATGVTAVVLNVAVTTPTASGYLTAFPAGEARPMASSLNFTPGLTVANTVVAKVGAGGKLSFFNSAGSTQVIVDVAGWFDGGGAASASRYHPVVPSRILDTRMSSPIGAAATLDVPVVNRAGVPASGVRAVVVNLTVTTPSAAGFLTVFPTGTTRPPTSSLNFAAGATVPNLVVAGVGAGGSVSIFNHAGVSHVIADLAGWFDQGNAAGGARYHPVTPARILDTRIGVGAAGPGQLGPGASHDLQVTGAGGVPASGVGAVVMNVTVAGPTAQSFLTVFPAGGARPNTANLNFIAGQVVPNLVVAKLGTGGRVSIFNQAGATDVIADVSGWFDAG